uniref:Mitochondrial MC16 n=1 Tax=Starmerella bombicola TaxID=75736 RepID=A0A6M8Y9G2_STABO|nr:mitochondrial MC16 [Starmerella bombicola]
MGDSEEPGLGQDHSFNRKAKDTLAGFVGGAVQVLVGQPFDLVKVRMQTGQYSNMYEAITQTFRKEGPLAFYKGTSAPLFGVGACVSLQFYAFHEAKRQMAPWSQTFPGIYACGAVAGFANTVLTSPVEHVRILMQAQRSAKGQYSGALDAAKSILRQHGVAKLYRGAAITSLREIQAYGTWFLTFEYLIHTQVKQGTKREDVPAWKLMLCGALAGEALWIASYPLDVIKSKVQSEPIIGSKFKGAIDAARQTWATQGLRGFWTGITPTLLRALPASACTFASVELTLRALG